MVSRQKSAVGQVDAIGCSEKNPIAFFRLFCSTNPTTLAGVPRYDQVNLRTVLTKLYRILRALGARNSAQSPSSRAAPRSDDTLSHTTFKITTIGAPKNSPQRPHSHPQNMIPTKIAT